MAGATLPRIVEVVIGLVELYRISVRCVCHVLVPPGNKDSLTKEESRCVYKCDDERLTLDFQKCVK